MGSTKIAQLPVDSRDPLGLIRATKTAVCLFGDRRVVASVSEANRVGLTAGAQMLRSVAPQRLQQRVADPPVGSPDGDHRGVHQRRQQVDHVTAPDAVT